MAKIFSDAAAPFTPRMNAIAMPRRRRRHFRRHLPIFTMPPFRQPLSRILMPPPRFISIRHCRMIFSPCAPARAAAANGASAVRGRCGSGIAACRSGGEPVVARAGDAQAAAWQQSGADTPRFAADAATRDRCRRDCF